MINTRLATRNQDTEFEWIGDILLLFGDTNQNSTARHPNAELELIYSDGDWQFLGQAPGPFWRGFPLTSGVRGPWHFRLLGEFYGRFLQSAEVLDILVKILCGQLSPDCLNGHFLLFAYNTTRGEWHIWTDRFGTIHGYYGTHGNRTAIGTFFPAVASAASARKLDWVALSGFFSLGHFPEDRTFFEGMKILRSATHYVWDQNGGLIQEKRYWNWTRTVDPHRSYDETVLEFGRIFQEVMNDQLEKGRIGIPISGGLDSRSTVAALSQIDGGDNGKDHFWAYSYGYSLDSVEINIARQVAKRCGLPFKAFTIQPYLFENLTNVLASVEGFQDLTQCRQAFVAENLSTHTDFLIAAHWGDVWLDDMGWDKWRSEKGVSRGSQNASDIFSKTLDFLYGKMGKNGRAWLHKHMCVSQLTGEHPEHLTKEMIAKTFGYLHDIEEVDFRIKAFKTEQWSFRWTLASIRMFQSSTFPRLPFYDTRVTDFLSTVPTEYLMGRRLQIDYLKKFAPDLATIKWQEFDVNLFQLQYFNSWLVARREIMKAWRIVNRKQVIQRNWEVQFLSSEGRLGLEHWLLRTGLNLHEFIPPLQLRELINDFFESPFEQGRGYTLSMLLTFSSWLETYG